MLLINGAIPFYSSPNFQQGIWAQGFAKSFSNSDSFTIFAKNFGYPSSNPISFGLPAVLISSFFLEIGLYSADAYSFSFAIFLIIAFIGAFNWARLFLDPNIASFAALLWSIQPIIIGHHAYSMLALGFALLPMYTYVVFKLIKTSFISGKSTSIWVLILTSTTIVSLFMDGYTFMMFALFSILSWFYISVYDEFKKTRKIITKDTFIKLFSIVFSFSIATFLYNLYFPGVNQTFFSMDIYRSMGVDLTFLLFPTENEILLGDILNFSRYRNSTMFFGDSSTFKTTYSLPLIIVSILFLYIFRRRKMQIKTLFIIISLISFYLALGPSLKINALNPPTYGSQVMLQEFAGVSTGNEIIYTYFPGFKSMRATYRWTGLFVFCCWVFTVLFVSSFKFKNKSLFQGFIFIILIISYIPNLSEKLSDVVIERSRLIEFEEKLSPLIAKNINSDDVVLFMPLDNDFSANFLSSHGNYYTYSIGGDKNFDFASSRWPKNVFLISELFLNLENFNEKIFFENLKTNEVVILTFFDKLFPGKYYCFESIPKDSKLLINVDDINFNCSQQFPLKKQYLNFLDELEKYNKYQIKIYNDFAIIKLDN